MTTTIRTNKHIMKLELVRVIRNHSYTIYLISLYIIYLTIYMFYNYDKHMGVADGSMWMCIVYVNGSECSASVKRSKLSMALRKVRLWNNKVHMCVLTRF